MELARTLIVQSAAIELLQRLTETLEIPFTLTDREGAVIASTAGRPTGQVDPFAIHDSRQSEKFRIRNSSLLKYSALFAYGLARPCARSVYDALDEFVRLNSADPCEKLS